MTLTLKQAKEMSLRKWKSIIEFDDRGLPCGFCEMFKKANGFVDCPSCPLFKMWGGQCIGNKKTPYLDYANSEIGSKRELYWAMVIYFDILSVEV